MPISVPVYGPALSPMCSTWSRESANASNISSSPGPGSSAYPAANKAHYFPMQLPRIGMAYKFWWLNGATASTNNIQVGVYADNGSYLPGAAIKLGTATLASGASVVQLDDIADTQMGPGLVWFAIWCNGTTATLFRSSNFLLRQSRFYTEASLTGGLPATATPATEAVVYFPIFGVQFRASP